MKRSRAIPLLLSALIGCATPYAKIDGVLANTRPVTASEAGRVTVVKDGARRNGELQQSVDKGDSLLTLADGVALLTIRPGYEVIVEPGSVINIENPSIFVTVGKLFLRKLREASEALRLNTRFTSAGVEGTEFTFEVLPDQTVRLVVLEGSVWIRPRTAAANIILGGAQSIVIPPSGPPGPIQAVDEPTIRTLRERRFAIERGARYATGEPWSRFKPLWQKPAFLVPAAAVVAAGVVAALVIPKDGTRNGTVLVNIPF